MLALVLVALTVGHAPYELPATLTLPDGTGPFPAVLLVHGSGPMDRDETVGKTKLFADLAAGLAERGIASLRYDKRTFAHGDELTNDLTIDDEVLSDAIDAVHVLATRPEVSRVIVVGHSLGAMLAPEIAARAGHVSAVAMLAPPARPPLVVLRAQLRYLGAPRELLAQVEAALAVVELAALGDDPSVRVMGMPLGYWRDWEAHDGVAAAVSLGLPLLVLQGDRDYQVTLDDYAIWKHALGRRATCVVMAGDNHALIHGHAAPSPREYATEAHIDPRAIDQLVRFIARSGRHHAARRASSPYRRCRSPATPRARAARCARSGGARRIR